MKSLNAKRGNREAAHEDRIARLELGLRQSPVRSAPGQKRYAYIRWEMATTSPYDLSECELCDEFGIIHLPGMLGWIDTFSSVRPPTFGQHYYEIEPIGEEGSPRSEKRTLYRAVRYIGYSDLATDPPVPALIEFVGGTILGTKMSIGKILDSGGAAIQTTINGSAGDNKLLYEHIYTAGVSGSRFALPLQLQYESRCPSLVVFPALYTWAKCGNGFKSGKFPSYVGTTGSAVITADQAEAVTPPWRIDHGENFGIVGTVYIGATNTNLGTQLKTDFYLTVQYDAGGKYYVNGSIHTCRFTIAGVGGPPITGLSATADAANKHTASAQTTVSYGASNTLALDGIYASSGKIANLTVIITFGSTGNVTSVSVQATSLSAGYTAYCPAFMVHGGGGPI